MNELEAMKRAKMYLERLASGIDPLTGDEIPEDSIVNNVRISRCFFYVSGILGQVIDNGGEIKPRAASSKALPPFEITAEQMQELKPFNSPVGITMLVKAINEALGETGRKPLSVKLVTDWLGGSELIEYVENAEGTRHSAPTAKGAALGITNESRTTTAGRPYIATLYSPEAQQLIIDSLPEIAAN